MTKIVRKGKPYLLILRSDNTEIIKSDSCFSEIFDESFTQLDFLKCMRNNTTNQSENSAHKINLKAIIELMS